MERGERFTEADDEYLSGMGVVIDTATESINRLLWVKNSELLENRKKLADALEKEMSQHAYTRSQRDAAMVDASNYLSEAKRYERMFWALCSAIVLCLIFASIFGLWKYLN